MAENGVLHSKEELMEIVEELMEIVEELLVAEDIHITEIVRLQKIEAAARLVAGTLHGGFLLCAHCRDRVSLTEVDFARELYAALDMA